MHAREAFDAIQKKVKADPQKSFVESFFDEQVFGNFWITYDEGGERLSVVNDRGQLNLFGGPANDQLQKSLVTDLQRADCKAVLEAVN
jgi:hypothetical protein